MSEDKLPDVAGGRQRSGFGGREMTVIPRDVGIALQKRRLDD
jgi:hypothetical protein